MELRPRQWVKNAAVLAPLIFAHKALVLEAVIRASAAAIGFCLLSSAVYVFNDLLDRGSDRRHPLKRLRPIASGELGAGEGVALGIALAVTGLGLFLVLGAPALWGALGFLGLQAAYSLGLKRIALLDVLVIAAGFVIRVASGALAIDVPISNWLYLCTLLLALFLGLAKRRAELVLLEREAVAHRASLAQLSLPLLDQLISIVCAATIVSYALYSVSEETMRKVGGDGLKFTVPCVVYGIFRYLYLLHRKNEGGSPEKLLLSDPPLIAAIAVFLGIAGAVLYL